MCQRHWLEWSGALTWKSLLVLLVMVLVIREWVWMPIRVCGKSMMPTLHEGQICWINKLAYLRHPPRRGDIIAIWTGKELIVKRVVALPGEDIALRGGTFYVNGSPLTEQYVSLRDRCDIAPGKVDPNQFVVSGDNRTQTLVAVISRTRILGKVVP